MIIVYLQKTHLSLQHHHLSVLVQIEIDLVHILAIVLDLDHTRVIAQPAVTVIVIQMILVQMIEHLNTMTLGLLQSLPRQVMFAKLTTDIIHHLILENT